MVAHAAVLAHHGSIRGWIANSPVTASGSRSPLRISPRAIRGRIARSTIPWKAAGNTGKLVRVTEDDVSRDAPGDISEDAYELALLREELIEVREQLAGTKASLEAAVAIRKAETGALRELCDRLTAELADTRRELVEAHRPWWRRMLGR
jgi:hypothetical protein